jgi:SAM-dependent methyltransferase
VGWSTEWDTIYQSKSKHLSIWPWSDLVTHVMRNVKPADHPIRVLELGCGPGANIPFFQSLGSEYYAIEGSEFVVNSLNERYPALKGQITVGDFTKSIPFEGEFDLIVDRASITHNSTESIKACLDLVYNKLRFGGLYIGIDWFSTEHSDFSKGKLDEDQHTITSLKEGHLAQLGKVHFSDQGHLENLFHRFSITTMDHKLVHRTIPNDNFIFAAWNVVAVKEK